MFSGKHETPRADRLISQRLLSTIVLFIVPFPRFDFVALQSLQLHFYHQVFYFFESLM